MKITIPQKTTFYGQVGIYDADGSPILFEDGDYLIFGVKRTLCDSSAQCIIKKVITSSSNGICDFTLSTSDTNLPCGTYFYDVTLHRNNECYQLGEVDEFQITPSITSGESNDGGNSSNENDSNISSAFTWSAI